ncbi:MAG: hypothetical protein Q4B36_01830 [Tissierellia bacterium]|nr:hypothetical protein [Tissierellia bacterium]
MDKNISKKIFVVGLVIIFISFIIPVKSLEMIGINGIRPIGVSSLIICPILGLIGLVFAIKDKKYIFIFLNILLILSFPLVMQIGYLIN